MTDIIKKSLIKSAENEYRDFTAKLLPTVNKDQILGVRTPFIKQLAKRLKGTNEATIFLQKLPHVYHEENLLHAFLLAEEKDFVSLIKGVEQFLPYVDNWAVCDSFRPKIFLKHKTQLLQSILQWLKSDKEYTVRFAVGMLMVHFLDDDFKEEYLNLVANVKDDRYYVKMMVAWYFATALAKQYNTAIKYIEQSLLETWTHNKAIQKALESFRVEEKHKQYLRKLKIKVVK